MIPRNNNTIIWDPYESSPVLGNIKAGDKATLQYSFQGLPFEPEGLIQAGPMLVEKGQITSDFTAGSFLQGITMGRSPRTAVATTIHGEVLLVMAEGRLSMHSLGFTLKELAELLIEIGAVDAINLDGGSSSSLFVDGRFYGYPSSGFWKPVPDVILFGNFKGRGEETIF